VSGHAQPWPSRNTHQFDESIVWIAIHPILMWLEGLDDLVLRLVKVLCGVTVLRLVTATDVTTDAAKAEMEPFVSHLETLFASVA
jgi:hypothetical protein